ncbi:MAG: hypothetical protein AUJ92_15425 [Armatimonadetes bacterium CG2_30_59_28]|nr:hypothetical protein [Armatimonadota bacterium]OIO91908.1 MAG: hypothetical protein AUJ92_15425 [Armatimonadetes bacterium CG2_30_59_28]
MSDALYQSCSKAVHVVTSEGSVLRAGLACLFVIEHLGWGRIARRLRSPPMIGLVEVCYRIVAQNRRLFSHILFIKER